MFTATMRHILTRCICALEIDRLSPALVLGARELKDIYAVGGRLGTDRGDVA